MQLEKCCFLDFHMVILYLDIKLGRQKSQIHVSL